MSALDTHVHIRYLVADDKQQFESAKKLIDKSIEHAPLLVPSSVTSELEWVLRSLYELDKVTVITTFNRLLETRDIECQEEPSIEIALSVYADSNADFADCLHMAIASSTGKSPLLSFDRKASKVVGAQRLE